MTKHPVLQSPANCHEQGRVNSPENAHRCHHPRKQMIQ